MRFRHCTLISAGLLLLAAPCFALGGSRSTHSKRHYHASIKHAAIRHAYEKHSSRRHSLSPHARGLRVALHHEPVVKMPVERITEIQTALIKQGYMTGEPTGTWDAQTVAAMQKLQAENEWQTRITPDSRALIKLGLGPQAPDADPAASSASSVDPSPTLAQTPPQ